MAITSFESSVTMLPAGYAFFQGTSEPYWGWGVFLMPYLEQDALYDRLDPTNRRLGSLYNSTAAATDVALLQTTVANYRCPSDATPALNSLIQFGNARFFDLATSNYVASAGNWCTFNGCGSGVPLPCAVSSPDGYCGGGDTVDSGGAFFGRFDPKSSIPGGAPAGIAAATVRDGMSNTLAVGERSAANFAAVWAGGGRNSINNEHLSRTLGRPNFAMNIDYDMIGQPQNRGKGFSSPHPGGTQFVFLDGSVRFLEDSVNATLLTWMANRRDGQIVINP
jgi:prepilin-type processing-associated H-X9-DG protein